MAKKVKYTEPSSYFPKSVWKELEKKTSGKKSGTKKK